MNCVLQGYKPCATMLPTVWFSQHGCELPVLLTRDCRISPNNMRKPAIPPRDDCPKKPMDYWRGHALSVVPILSLTIAVCACTQCVLTPHDSLADPSTFPSASAIQRISMVLLIRVHILYQSSMSHDKALKVSAHRVQRQHHVGTRIIADHIALRFARGNTTLNRFFVQAHWVSNNFLPVVTVRWCWIWTGPHPLVMWTPYTSQGDYVPSAGNTKALIDLLCDLHDQSSTRLSIRPVKMTTASNIGEP